MPLGPAQEILQIKPKVLKIFQNTTFLDFCY